MTATARPRLLDLFCGAGGAGMGYHRAGFDVVGVDINPQPRYPFAFNQLDAMDVLSALTMGHESGLGPFDAIHASPPCQGYSDMSNCRPGVASAYPMLVSDVRDRLLPLGLPWVIENVRGAPMDPFSNLYGSHGVILCGRMFGLDLYRHRHFETCFPVPEPRHTPHDIRASKAGHWRAGTIISVAGNCAPIEEARRAMGIDWMNRAELAESIPPAFTEYVGRHLLAALRARA